MTDHVATCVREVVAIACGDEPVAERRKAAEQEIGWLLKNQAEKRQGDIAQDLHHRLSTAIKAEHNDEARKVLDHIIAFLQRKKIDG